MLVLHSTSRCDVCLVEYNWETSAKVPHAIACGHIFCRDCLYATNPPLCPLCRKAYQPAKIKKLHVDRPENVDEARESELMRQQVEMIEKLADLWDIHLPVETALGGSALALVGTSATSRLIGPPEDDSQDEDEPGRLPPEWDGREHEFILQQVQEGPLGDILQGMSSTTISRVAVTMREARQMQKEEVLREVDMWLQARETDECIALRKSRMFLTKHLEIIESSSRTMEEEKNRMKGRMEEEKQEMDRLRDLERQAAREDEERYAHELEELKRENTALKVQLASMQASLMQTHVSSPLQRNPLPPPPEPISTNHLPSLAQAMSETGSVYTGSVYGSGMGVRFAELAPSPPPRAKERYGASDEAHPSANSKNGKKKSKLSSKAGGYSPYSHRGDSGYYEEDEQDVYSRQPTSAPAVTGGGSFTPTPYSSQATDSALHPSQPAQPQTQSTYSQGGYTASQQPHATRSAALPTHFESTTQPLDGFTFASTYLREYTAGFVNGQVAAMGGDRYGYNYTPQPFSAPANTSTSRERERTTHQRLDAAESIISSAASDAAHDPRPLSRPSSRSRSHGTQYRNTVLESILNTNSSDRPPSRRHQPAVPLPATSSHGHSSPAVSFSSNQLGGSSIRNALGLENSALSPRPSASTRSSYSGRTHESAPESLPDDPEQAAAILRLRHPAYDGRRQSGSDGSWGTNPTGGDSNSLISNLHGLPTRVAGMDDNASVRTRGTRLSITSFEFGEGDYARASRRSSLGSEVLLSAVDGDASPARPVGSMVGVLPVDEHEREYEEAPSSTNRASSYMHPYLSASEVTLPLTSTSTRNAHGYTYGSTETRIRAQSQTLHQDPPPMLIPPLQSQPSQAQQIASSAGWSSSNSSSTARARPSLTTNANSSTTTINAGTTAGYYSEYERYPSSSYRRRDRDRDSRRREHDGGLEPVRERDRERDRESERVTANRASTSIGLNSTHGYNTSSRAGDATPSGSGWMWDSDSNVYPSPISHSNNEQIAPLPTTSNATSMTTLTRDRGHRSHRPRHSSHTQSDVQSYTQSQSQSHRPSLLSIESSPFPVSIETTDDERHGYESRRSGNGTNTSGRSTRTGGNSSSHSHSHSHPTSQASTEVNSPTAPVSGHGSGSPELQSFGNALGLELSGTVATMGISAPRPRASTQRFLRSFSHDRD